MHKPVLQPMSSKQCDQLLALTISPAKLLNLRSKEERAGNVLLDVQANGMAPVSLFAGIILPMTSMNGHVNIQVHIGVAHNSARALVTLVMFTACQLFSSQHPHGTTLQRSENAHTVER